MDALSLYELNNLVRSTLAYTLEPAYWVTAEVSSLQLHGGHCYLELVEKEPRTNGRPGPWCGATLTSCSACTLSRLRSSGCRWA